MSIKVDINAPGLALHAELKDEALPEIIKLTQQFREEQAAVATGTGQGRALGSDLTKLTETSASEDQVREWLKSHGAAELLNRLGWESYPEKILLLALWHEAQGGAAPWRSADMDATFAKAKEKPPANFPRDIKQAIKAGWIHAETPRTYRVTRTGWNKIGEALQRLQTT
jgi:hypothetical protein